MTMLKKRLIEILLKIRPAVLGSVIKKLLFSHREIAETSQGKFWIDPASNLGYKLLYVGEHEPYMIKTLQQYLQPGSTFIDLAANEGYFSVIASKLVGSQGKVFAIEPQSRLLDIINKNLDLNECNNVKILPIAISD